MRSSCWIPTSDASGSRRRANGEKFKEIACRPCSIAHSTVATIRKALSPFGASSALGIEDNEVKVLARVSKGGASVAAQKLELLEQQIRKLKLALVKAAAVGGIAA